MPSPATIRLVMIESVASIGVEVRKPSPLSSVGSPPKIRLKFPKVGDSGNQYVSPVVGAHCCCGLNAIVIIQ